MAQLKDLLVMGPSRFIGDVFANNLQAFKVTDNLIPIETNTYSLGSSDLRWKSLFIGTADTYGSTTQPIWWNNGVPQAVSYLLQAQVRYTTHAATTGGWEAMLGRQSNPTLSVVRHNSPVPTWISEAYSSSLVFGGSDTKGFINLGYNTPIVTLGGSSTGNSTVDAPKWWFKLTGTSGTTYNLDASPSANKLNTNAGSATQPIYFANGVPVNTTYALNATINAGTAPYVAYYSANGAISSAQSATNMIMPSHYYHTMYTNATTGTEVYVHYYNPSVTATNTNANFRIKNGSSWNTFKICGAGEATWDGTQIRATNGYLASTKNGNTITIGSQNTNFTHIYNSASIPFIFNNSILTVTGSLGNQAYPFNNLYLGKAGKRNIYFVSDYATHEMISFLSGNDANGDGIKIGGGGFVILGSGESSDTVLNNSGITSGGVEETYITSDDKIYFYPNANSGIDASSFSQIGPEGFETGYTGNTTREKRVRVNSGAGSIYMFSESTTDGNRGIWVPEHGTGDAKSVFTVDTNNNVTFNGSLTGANVHATTIKANRINEILVGTGTAGASTANSTPSEWIFDAGLDSLADGDIVTIKIPVAGSPNGVWLSVDNGTKYYPICKGSTGRLTTHFPVGEYITIIFDADGKAASVAPRGGGTQATQSGGVWQVINFYDTNTNTLLRVYSSSTNIDVPLIGQSSSHTVTAAWTSYTGTYKDWYGAIPNDDSKRAKINLSTGTITVPGGVVGNLTGNAATATKFASAQSVTLTGDTTGTVSSQAGWNLATTNIALSGLNSSWQPQSGSSSRPTTANVTFADNKIRYYLATSSMTEGKPGGDAHIIHMAWDNGKWDAQLSVGTSNLLQYRVQGNTDWTNSWITVLDTNNYTSYVPTKTGSGASGTWSISISGSAAKLGTTTVGSTTKPIYLNAGVATEASTYAGGTLVTLNGTAKGASTASFYAPTSAGTSGQVLKSNGSSAPTWQAEYSYTHPSFTAVAAAAVKVGMNNQGHVVLGTALAASDISGLGTLATKSSLTADDIPSLSTTKLTSGTLSVGRGGTGLDSFTTNKIYYASASTTLTASSHSINSTQMAINTTIQTGYALYVSGAFTATTLILPTSASSTQNAIWIGS